MQNYSHPFVKYVRHECRRYGCKLKLIYKSELVDDDNSIYSGHFLDDPLELVVATRVLYTTFLSTLVHEYSHMEQWRDKSKYYVQGYRGWDSWDIMNRWLQGHEFKRTTINRSINVIRNCEVDCERRAIKNIKKFNIPVNIKSYCQKANVYIYFHNYIKKTRVWDCKKEPNDCPQILKAMPDNLDGDYSKMPRKIMRLYKKYVRP